MLDNLDRNIKIKNSVHSWVHSRNLKDTWELGERGLSDCAEGRWRDWNHARKYPKLAWAGWRRPWILVSGRGRNCSDIFIYLHWHLYIIKFSIYLFSKFFVFYDSLLPPPPPISRAKHGFTVYRFMLEELGKCKADPSHIHHSFEPDAAWRFAWEWKSSVCARPQFHPPNWVGM
jgi:hypothetical protein